MPKTDDTKARMKRKEYEKELLKLQTELCRLQDWVVQKGLRIIVIFEGRDTAGKGGTIKAIMERVSPRVFRLVALPCPFGPRKNAALCPALHAAFPGGRRSRHLRSQLVQPCRRGIRDGILHEGAISSHLWSSAPNSKATSWNRESF